MDTDLVLRPWKARLKIEPLLGTWLSIRI
jgi:hypothetical protein